MIFPNPFAEQLEKQREKQRQLRECRLKGIKALWAQAVKHNNSKKLNKLRRKAIDLYAYIETEEEKNQLDKVLDLIFDKLYEDDYNHEDGDELY